MEKVPSPHSLLSPEDFHSLHQYKVSKASGKRSPPTSALNFHLSVHSGNERSKSKSPLYPNIDHTHNNPPNSSEHSNESFKPFRSNPNIPITITQVERSLMSSKRSSTSPGLYSPGSTASNCSISSSKSSSSAAPTASNGMPSSTPTAANAISAAVTKSSSVTTAVTGSGTSSSTTTSGSGGGPQTKNIGVGANLNRNSSASVSLGHGHLGIIQGPSSVSISSGMNTSLMANGSSNSSSTTGSGRPGFGNHTSTSSSSSLSGGVGHHQGLKASTTNISPGLIPSTILPELLQQAHGGSQSGSSLSSSGPRSLSNSTMTTTAATLGINHQQQNPGTTKVGLGSPVKQGILGRHQSRGESINNPGNTATTTTTPTNNSTTTANKIVSQNVNGILALTSIPSNESELQLFRVLQRANLLTYFDVMIELGGDDVQQLCEAGEEEFLEIMALIGMASKPLHVRRFQKALQEWMSIPALFQAPVLPPGVGPSPRPPSTADLVPTPPTLPPGALTPDRGVALNLSSHAGQHPPAATTSPASNGNSLPIRPIPYHSSGAPSAAAAMAAAAAAAQQAMFLTPSEMKSMQNKLQVLTNGHSNGGSNSGNSPSGSGSVLQHRPSHHPSHHLSPNHNHPVVSLPNHSFSNGYHHHPSRSIERLEREALKEKESQLHGSLRIPVDQIIPSHFLEQRIRTGSEPNSPAASECSPASSEGSSLSPVPFLQEGEIQKLADAAVQIVKTLPPYVFEPQVPSKRKFSGDFELILRLSSTDPRRMEEIRKASIVYGKAESYSSNTHPNKRKYPKPLTMQEVSVNEAAAQLCKHVPALLTRREELFALAKQVVRDAGLPYSSNNFSISLIHNNNNNNNHTFANHNLKYKGTSSNNGNGLHMNQHNIELHHQQDYYHREGSSMSNGGSGGYHPKKLRIDHSGIEIQEYHRPGSNHSDGASDNDSNAMQITPIRSLPRRSPSDDHSPLPLELVTVTTSSPRGQSDSGSPHSSYNSRRSVESDDLSCSNNGYRIVTTNGTALTPSSVKITSIPVSGGCINISQGHDQPNGMKLVPIKQEPAN